MTHQTVTIPYWGLIIMFILTCLLFVIACSPIFVYLNKNIIMRRQTCPYFSSQADAQSSLKDGKTYLDRNKDGIACNSLLR